jgi:LysM repeat protein/ABC-type branched-subunit amino acid transport system substrate-binding protein
MNRLYIILLLTMLVAGSCATAQYSPSKIKISKEIVRNESGEFYIHRVQPSETLFSISKAYNVDVNQLSKDNPKIAEGLKAGEILLVRRENLPDGQYVKHTVRWFDSLESISEKYNVKVEDIITLNKLDSKELKTRQVILIPDLSYVSKSLVIAEDTANEKREAELEKPVNRAERPANNHIHNVSLIIPADSKNIIENSNVGNNYIDFYHGFLMAVNDAKEDGISMNVEVIDSKEYQNSSQIVYSGRIDKSELIIGPVFSSEIEGMLPFAKEREIPIVSPMDPAAEKYIEGNPNFMQISVADEDQQRVLLSSIPLVSHVALFYEKGGKEERMLNVTQSFLDEYGIPYKSFSYGLLEGRSVGDQLLNQLEAERENYVIVISNSEAFVSDVLRNLNLISSRNGYKITILGLPRWRNFESVDINYYHSMNLHLAMQYYVDYSKEDVKKFLAKYRALFGAEPSPYSFQAYDLGRYYTKRLTKYGRRLFEFIEEEQEEMLLQSNFKFLRRSSGSGLSNSTARIIVYRPDFSVELLTTFR